MNDEILDNEEKNIEERINEIENQEKEDIESEVENEVESEKTITPEEFFEIIKKYKVGEPELKEIREEEEEEPRKAKKATEIYAKFLWNHWKKVLQTIVTPLTLKIVMNIPYSKAIDICSDFELSDDADEEIIKLLSELIQTKYEKINIEMKFLVAFTATNLFYITYVISKAEEKMKEIGKPGRPKKYYV